MTVKPTHPYMICLIVSSKCGRRCEKCAKAHVIYTPLPDAVLQSLPHLLHRKSHLERESRRFLKELRIFSCTRLHHAGLTLVAYSMHSMLHRRLPFTALHLPPICRGIEISSHIEGMSSPQQSVDAKEELTIIHCSLLSSTYDHRVWKNRASRPLSRT
ncbi:hypothetical protein P174DRAFT_151946 [Aspergillus novofumigatus IBT 16806]|uniref:Uncharacterized protein n=1 Tax=Aspergillus novofumigatus (strain IBT 16806) TaxID=1392255 RepID=A0A2I1CEN9_ASPN1|nr:uncharacterized protein P174DRAFT_151946 [Aspergillus novofumigatus IBT 16806]PKX96080.1 hypothetical protein P174DRAFT_151946 [Aspergillus novofumigatus IBT 16806]